ncbi:electron transfer flavoprotein subunit beta/FixA family protein [Halobellus sp. GM3]|uniref:electron transfer flavoprotein subunit beta/FixA family protein n=1 Tax=Halobellus sp. GM3 TaxID=3458410 RepID=UPI00403DBDAD
MRALVTARSEPHRVLDDDGTAEPYRMQLSIDDRVALEAALDAAEEVVAVGVGGDDARACVRSALERGADRGIHVRFDPIESIAGEKFATALARVAARESPDAVFVGESSSFSGPEIAGLAAARLDWPSVTRVTELGAENLDADAADPDAIDDRTSDTDLAVQRKLAIGRQEVVVASLPVVIGVDAGFADPDRASMDTVIAGRRAEIESNDLADLVPGETRFSMSIGGATVEHVTPNERWGRGRPPRTGTVEERIYRMLGRGEGETRSAGERIDAPPEDAADRVVEFLRANELL